ncbi:MAG: signal peptidase I [Arsenophonus endosymbiont of Ceratovacuna japonica]
MANIFYVILTLITFITGIIWVINNFKFIYTRNKKITHNKNIIKKDVEEDISKPSWIDACSSIFPILAIILIVRSFIYEPFQIPSDSMMPTLLNGDFILVEKFAYGLKDLITHTMLLETGKPRRGDIVVFKYPKDPSINFIKRVIGLPGDKIIYNPELKELHIYPNYLVSDSMRNLSITYSLLKESKWALFFNINDITESQKGTYQISLNELVPNNALRQSERIEKLDSIKHDILIIPQVYTKSYYQQPGLQKNEWIVPPKHYFMMGDNRDNSLDSRMWGFVPEKNLVGRAIMIWFSLDKNKSEWPTGVRLSRIGMIN